MKIAAIAIVAGIAGVASAQTAAAYTVSASPSPVTPNGIISVQVMGGATAGQIGNNSGINGVNLSVEIAGGDYVDGSFAGNGEVFGGVNFAADGEGFDTSFSSNSFAGVNFSDGLVLFSFDVMAGASGTVDITTSEGTISLFAAATGLPGAFQTSVGYDSIDFGSASVAIVPAPGAAALLGLGGLAVARRRR
ncbi:MAG: hypothetical protein AAF297_03010 [Planctomycetota bacterium]